MKSFTLILYFAAMSMVVSAHFVQLIYNQNDEPAIHQYGRCVPFLNPAGMPPATAKVVTPTICRFFNDNNCRSVAQNVPPLNVYPGPPKSIQRPRTLPRSILCRPYQ
ncbi:hypothetical protein BCR42DRAFT_399021 [Absidia repens]|uniref:Uncharacterized protein n=1 Tax=Absidia repens TaxID=90262 RepID=A0A1X2HKB6_9FUNG|nr:hypothetical protein BCR42DRAFT_399021 [Absidia repens]